MSISAHANECTKQEIMRSIKDSNDTVRNDGAMTRRAIRDLQAEEQQYHLSERDREVIESFKFPGMFDRQDSLHPAAQNTFRWILDGNENTR